MVGLSSPIWTFFSLKKGLIRLFSERQAKRRWAENLGQDQNDGDEYHDQEQGLEVEACDMAVFLHKPPSPLRRCSRTLPASVVMRS